jgi:hypothetical protein
MTGPRLPRIDQLFRFQRVAATGGYGVKLRVAVDDKMERLLLLYNRVNVVAAFTLEKVGF